MHLSRRCLPTLGAFLLLAAPAAAQGPTPTATPTASPTASPTVSPVPTIVPTVSPTPSPTPTPRPQPLRARMGIHVFAPHRADGKKLAVKGEKIRVQGRLRPAVAGQRAVIQLRLNGKKVVKRKQVRFDRAGRFSTRIAVKTPGNLAVRVLHRGNKAVKAVKSPRKSLTVLNPALHIGSSGPLVTLFTRGLHKLRFAVWPTKYYDDRVARGVLAYRKVNRLARTETPTPQIIRDVLAGKGAYKVKYPGLGRHVEADLTRQILSLIDVGGKLVRTYHTSSGKPSTPTVTGTFTFYSKTPGTNDHGMVDSNYFIRGYAIHGYYDVPAYNASHGCLRVPIPDAAAIYNWVRIGDKIRVEY